MAKKPVKKKAAKPAKKPASKPVKTVKKPALKAAPKKAASKAAAVKKPAPAKKALAKPVAVKKAAAKAVEPKLKKAIEPKSVKLNAKPIPEKVAKKAKVKIEEIEPQVAEIEIEEPSEEEGSEEIVLTDAEGRRYCRVKDCDQVSTVDGYCRYHYLLYWKKIQVRKKILTEGKLERYVEDLTARYPDKFLEMLRKDLRSEKEFFAAIQELEIDESANENEFEDEAATYIEEVRGMAEPGGREEEDF